MLTLYDHPLSGNCEKVRLLLSILQIPYESVLVDVPKGVNRESSFTRINPLQQIPVLTDGSYTVQDSQAILLYLAERSGVLRPQDEVEAALIGRFFPATTRASSTKGFTGHTLGAAGIVEATIALQAIEHGLVPGNLGGDTPDPICGAHFAWRNEYQRVDVALSNSFGFGGNNACLAFARAGIAA